ncbi:MAG: glycosyltransferase 87 family protein [bacterium]
MAAFAVKVVLATRTAGTQDIRAWTWFAEGVRSRGPVGVYAIDFAGQHRGQYNHPPLVGYLLEGVNALADLGVPLRVTIRLLSSAADVGSALLLFSLLRRRVPLSTALFSGVAVAASPVLVLVSGYHGNTDPVFMMLVLLATYLVADRQRPGLGGVGLAAAVGIKLIPVIVAPVLLAFLLRRSGPAARRAGIVFLSAFLATSALLWVPAVIGHWAALRQNVLGYVGVDTRPWGLVHFADMAGASTVASALVHPGARVVVAICALLPAVRVWRHPEDVVGAVALALAGFLLLSPAFGVQYVVWALAPLYLLEVWSGVVFDLAAALVLFVVYDRWNGGLPWVRVAIAQPWTRWEETLAALLWALLAVAVGRAVISRTGYEVGSARARPAVGSTVPGTHGHHDDEPDDDETGAEHRPAIGLLAENEHAGREDRQVAEGIERIGDVQWHPRQRQEPGHGRDPEHEQPQPHPGVADRLRREGRAPHLGRLRALGHGVLEDHLPGGRQPHREQQDGQVGQAHTDLS